jgi:hypothetical protein
MTTRLVGGEQSGARAKAVREQMDVTKAPRLLLRTNKPDGFDCPGCAWPDQEHTFTFQFWARRTKRPFLTDKRRSKRLLVTISNEDNKL